MSAYFITATGTNMGKTFATCALLHAAKHAGVAARALKPVITGWRDADSSSDIGQILEAGSASPAASVEDYFGVEDISLYRFTAPLSPHMAAVREGKTIDPNALIDWCRARMMGEGLTLIEGAGGVMVPLTEHYTMLDFMAALNIPLILVVGSYLGSISHALTAIEVLRARSITIAALILNESMGSTVPLAEAQAGLWPFIQHIPLRIVQPRVSSWHEAYAIHALVEKL